MSQIYLTLPSSSSIKIYPENTKLQREILLESEEWEVGLAEIHFPYNRRMPQTLHVYCDMIEYQPVGDGTEPLLRIIPAKGKKMGEIITQVYDKPHYLSVKGGVLRTVEIRICDNVGGSIELGSGSVTTVLHLRRVREPYFHL